MVYARPLRQTAVCGGPFTWTLLVSPFSLGGKKREIEIKKEKVFVGKNTVNFQKFDY